MEIFGDFNGADMGLGMAISGDSDGMDMGRGIEMFGDSHGMDMGRGEDHGGFSTAFQGYGFVVTNGQVTGMEGIFGTASINLPLPSNASFAYDATSNTITETLTGTTGMESIQYTATAANPALYQITQETTTITSPTTTTWWGGTEGFNFTSTNGQVTGIQEVFNAGAYSATENMQTSPSTVFSMSGTTVTETSIHGNKVETTTYTQPAGSSLYAVAAETSDFILPGTATTALWVNPCDRANFTVDGSGNVTQVQAVSPTGVATTVTPGAADSFQQVAPGYVQETITHGTNSNYVLFYENTSATVYTEVAHGSGTTVDLVGIQAQLAHVPTALLSLL